MSTKLNNDWLDCPICLNIMSDAIDTPCCHECYCRLCLSDWISRNQTCPSCRKELDSAKNCQKNFKINRMINELPIECSNKSCPVPTTRGNIDDHLKTCEFQIVRCPNNPLCLDIIRKDIAAHSEICDYRIVSCPLCNLESTKKELPNHLCPNIIIECKLNCGIKFKLSEEESHRNECLMEIVECFYSSKGCQSKVNSKKRLSKTSRK